MTEISDFHAFAHDLRHYLRQSITQSQLALRRSAEQITPELKSTLEVVIRAGLKCDELIKAMVQYSEAGTQPNRTWPLRRALQALPLDVRPQLDAVGARLSIEYSGTETPDIPQSLQEVWHEFVTNSIRFRRPEVLLEMVLQIRLEPERLHFHFHDTGIGIAPQHRDEIFLPFRRLHARDAYPGFGLGLPKCRKILQSLGGDIQCVDWQDGAAFEGWCHLPSMEAAA